MSRRLTSSDPKRHTLMLPSAVSRNRLHVPQKCLLIDVMNPTVPLKPGTRQALDVSLGLSAWWVRWMWGKRRRMTVSISSYAMNLESRHWFPSKGMYSMKRTSREECSVKATKSASSSSFCPRITTQLILRVLRGEEGSSFAARAASRLAWAILKPLRRVMKRNFCGTSVSNDMFMPSSPAWMRAGSCLERVRPLVVMPMLCSPCRRSSEI
mmetsp:Transcript_49216/g.100499  ORF Transcript_49216/g.100499 Transcript_49216/m.100499 type:complete len:211 (-) Transcript_49216:663-1295(-)